MRRQEGITMEHQRESYPDQIRRIAEDLAQIRHLWEVGHAAEKLHDIANGIEKLTKTMPDDT